MRFSIVLLLFVMLSSCEKDVQTKLMSGHYRATLDVQDNKQLPFNFKVTNENTIEIYNAEEVVLVDEILYFNDSIRINFPVYEGYIVGKFHDGKVSEAKYIKESLDRVVDVTIIKDVNERFLKPQKTEQDVTGIWEIVFTEDDGSTFIGKGIFKQKDNIVTGTIRTTTGDYRFLDGVMDANELKLSAFDGAHAFLFTASAEDDKLSGVFYSGNHYKAKFEAKLNPDYELPHEDTLTALKEGYSEFAFAFPDASGKVMSLKDSYFEDKVVIVQLMGTWCPNCLEESIFFSKYYTDNKDKDLAFVALAFEYAKTEEKAFNGINKLKSRLNIEYPILLAQYGTSDKAEAQKKLPMLNHVLSYPTTIFIDKKGEVRKIHTGFNGKATGEKYLSYKKEFDDFVNLLLKE